MSCRKVCSLSFQAPLKKPLQHTKNNNCSLGTLSELDGGIEWLTLLYLSSGPGINYQLFLFSNIELYT